MLYRIASIPIVGFYNGSGQYHGFNKKAQVHTDTIKRSINLISKDRVNAISHVYNLSNKIDDYIFPIARAVTADVANSNADLFSHNELTRFSPEHKCQVFETFRSCPLHIEHAAADPKSARGFIVDSFYIQDNPKDRHVINLIAMDTTKDPPLANALLNQEISTYSMGCVCAAVQCSYCNKKATTDRDLCEHLMFHKNSTINGQKIHEKCLGVEFQELSVVGDPADVTAQTQYILKAASREENQLRQHYSVLSSLVSEKDRKEIARYFSANINRLPDAMLRLGDKIL